MHATRIHRRQALRGSVFVEFFIFMLMWFALAGVSMQILLTLNRQINVNYVCFLAGRAAMGQPTDDERDKWIDYVGEFYGRWHIENRLHGMETKMEYKEIDGGNAVVAKDEYRQVWAGLINMATPMATGGNKYPSKIPINSWAYAPRCDTDEETNDEEHDNDVDDYGGYVSNANTVGDIVSLAQQFQNMF